jgi:hypothetical protein
MQDRNFVSFVNIDGEQTEQAGDGSGDKERKRSWLIGYSRDAAAEGYTNLFTIYLT